MCEQDRYVGDGDMIAQAMCLLVESSECIAKIQTSLFLH